MRQFVILSEDDGVRLNRFLQKCVPSLSGGEMYKFLRSKRIKLNGARCEASTRLSAGDVLELYINDDFFGKGKKQPNFMSASRMLTIIYEDDNIALLYKPAGLLVHDDSSEFPDTLINRFLRHLFECGSYNPDEKTCFTPSLCNRLDRGTSGIVIAAKNSTSLSCMNLIIKERRAVKKYLCVTVSEPPRDGRYTCFLMKNSDLNRVYLSDKERDGSKQIVTEIKKLSENKGLHLLEIGLVTGRTHQIRAHLAHLGAPILGDGKYGNGEINRRYKITRQALCAYRLSFDLNETLDKELFYLNNKSFQLDDVWFCKEYFPQFKL
ncbi:MAG: RluA family pseudouridine synthase [Oscillospiraceae bacterium]